jgi:hypothetical protein
MIIFELCCAQGHRFEGWFASSDAFAHQQQRGLVTCPMCDDAQVERVPSARVSVPKVQSGRAGSTVKAHTEPREAATAEKTAESDNATSAVPSEGAEAVALGMPREVLAKLREIVRNTENVGRRFPEEARKIHYRETPPRAIRGEASRDEAQALTEEGIEFASLPPFLTSDTH